MSIFFITFIGLHYYLYLFQGKCHIIYYYLYWFVVLPILAFAITFIGLHYNLHWSVLLPYTPISALHKAFLELRKQVYKQVYNIYKKKKSVSRNISPTFWEHRTDLSGTSHPSFGNITPTFREHRTHLLGTSRRGL